jgi:hypothetical protein
MTVSDTQLELDLIPMYHDYVNPGPGPARLRGASTAAGPGP